MLSLTLVTMSPVTIEKIIVPDDTDDFYHGHSPYPASRRAKWRYEVR